MCESLQYSTACRLVQVADLVRQYPTMLWVEAAVRGLAAGLKVTRALLLSLPRNRVDDRTVYQEKLALTNMAFSKDS